MLAAWQNRSPTLSPHQFLWSSSVGCSDLAATPDHESNTLRAPPTIAPRTASPSQGCTSCPSAREDACSDSVPTTVLAPASTVPRHRLAMGRFLASRALWLSLADVVCIGRLVAAGCESTMVDVAVSSSFHGRTSSRRWPVLPDSILDIRRGAERQRRMRPAADARGRTTATRRPG